MEPKLVNPKELSEMLRISKATLWRYIKSGIVPQPKRLSKQNLLWDLDNVLSLMGLVEAEPKKTKKRQLSDKIKSQCKEYYIQRADIKKKFKNI